MLDDLRRIIESEMEYDDLNDIMMEATDNSIADMFIAEDGEAVISDSEVMSILEKIPDYDEEAAMNKKLARIAEAYIPEELEYEEVEEGFISKKILKKYSNKDLQEKMNKLQEEIEELEGNGERDKKQNKRLAKAKKELEDIKKFMDENYAEVQESTEVVEDEFDFLYEAFGLENLKRK